MLRLVKGFYLLIALLIGIMIVMKSIDYFTPDFNQGFLMGKSEIFSLYKPFLYAHIIGAPIAFLTGLFQFTFNKSNIHKPVGIVYVASILLMAGPGGLLMSFYALGGIVSIVNFLILSLLWLIFTGLAFYYALEKKFVQHRSMMIRSFILTNSAILIRILSFANHQLEVVGTELSYIIISWVSWLPSLLAYEVWRIWKKLAKPT